LKENLSLNDIKFKKESNIVITASYDKNSHKFDDIINVLKTNNIEILDILTEDSDLEDVFVQLTKH
jgi:ABC-type multidrug transport system ATPase subunit